MAAPNSVAVAAASSEARIAHPRVRADGDCNIPAAAVAQRRSDPTAGLDGAFGQAVPDRGEPVLVPSARRSPERPLAQRTIKSNEQITAMLRSHDINPTNQRVEIAQVLFTRCEHMSAEDVYVVVNTEGSRASKATVYNTLGLFAKKGLVREVIADPVRIFYDPNTTPHHHFYDTASGKLLDIPAEQVQICGLPTVPDGMNMEGVDVIVRVRPRGSMPE